MSLLTHPSVIWLRNVLRAAGLTKSLALLRSKGGYEAAVDTVLQETLRPGDVVWDVGANVGVYTVKMAKRVGPEGKVFAIEPSSKNLEQLRSTCANITNISILPMGLSSAVGRAKLQQGSDELGATSRLAAFEEPTSHQQEEVDLCSGDDLVKSGMAGMPNVAKVDVEGHEYEVLDGLSELLKDSRFRALIMEVHFGLLASAGRADVPALIESRLSKEGFKVEWIDPSHLHASRPNAADATR